MDDLVELEVQIGNRAWSDTVDKYMYERGCHVSYQRGVGGIIFKHERTGVRVLNVSQIYVLRTAWDVPTNARMFAALSMKPSSCDACTIATENYVVAECRLSLFPPSPPPLLFILVLNVLLFADAYLL